MSSIDKAFVKAFSRRNVSSNTEATPAPTMVPVDEPGSLKVDPSVAQSAMVWVDPIENVIARADTPEPSVPKPHVQSPELPIDASIDASGTTVERAIESLQHIHTAYASAAVEQPSAALEQSSSTVEQPSASAAPPAFTDHVAAPPRDELGPVVQMRIDPGVTQTAKPIAETAAQPMPREAEPTTPITEPFHAAWEVDVFDIPTTVADLFFEGQLFQQIAERLLDAVNTGLSNMLITSVQPGEGRSSVAIGMAMAAAAAGVRVALVDGDTKNPTLAEDLRLQLEHGWVDTIRGGLPIREVAVHAVEDGLTLIPLMAPQGIEATAFETAQLIALLKDRFDLVIVDGPAGTSPGIHQYAAEFDSVVVVADSRRTDAGSINEMSYRLRDAGVVGIGVVENFV